MKKEIMMSYNILSLSSGPLEQGELELETSSLNGFPLDYTLAKLCNLPYIRLNYLTPDFRHAEVLVKISEHDIDTQRWQPSREKKVAERLLAELPSQMELSDDQDIIVRLRAIVLEKYGKTVRIPYPVSVNS